MKVFICYGRFGGDGHSCARAAQAVEDAGYQPQIVKCYGAGVLPGLFNMTPGRREVKRLTGNYMVPVLVTDEGEVIQDSKKIVAWAKANPKEAA
jgi:hypothetical protein